MKLPNGYGSVYKLPGNAGVHIGLLLQNVGCLM